MAVIGDGALPSGIVFEAFNHASGLKKKLLVILNDNKMSICPRVGGLADYLDRARMSSTYNDWNKRVKSLLPNIPLVGEHAERWLQQFKDAIKASLHHGMLFEELGFIYLGPIDGHDLKTLRSYLEQVKAMDGPVLLHVLTNKGHGFEPAVKDPVKFHAPAPFQKTGNGIVPLEDLVEPDLHRRRQRRALRGMPPRPQGRRDHRRHVRGEQAPEDPRDLPRASSSTSASARATPWRSPPAWPRPAPGRSSTSTARSSSGRTTRSSRRSRSRTCRSSSASTAPGWSAPTGPTHHGTYDLAYLRVFPNMVVMAPGDEKDIAPDVRLRPAAHLAGGASATPGPTSRRSSARSSRSSWARPRSSSGRPTACSWPAARWSGAACGRPSGCDERYGLRVGVVNARFVKPLDRVTIGKAIEECGFVLTVEEGCLMGGFGSAVLEAANDAGLPTSHVRRLGLPDRYVMHAERDEQLAEVGLDVDGITRAALELARSVGLPSPSCARAGGRRHGQHRPRSAVATWPATAGQRR